MSGIVLDEPIVKKLKIILLASGMALLFAGVFLQDFHVSLSAAQEYNERAHIQTMSRWELEHLFLNLRYAARTGLIGGFVALFFWISTMAYMLPFRSPHMPTESLTHQEFLTKMCSPHVNAWVFSLVLFICAIFVPILCAFSLRRQPEPEQEPKEKNKAFLPLIAGILTIVVLVIAGYVGFRQNPYKAALQEISLDMGIHGGAYHPDVDNEMALIDSEEGISFLVNTIRNPREFYWHRYIACYLWNHSGNPRAKELLLDILCDSTHLIASAHAADAITGSLGFGSNRDGEAFVLSLVSKKPEHGPKLIHVVLEYGCLSTGFVIEIMKTCTVAGIEKFTFQNKVPVFEDDNMLIVPEEFALYYRRKHSPDTDKLVVKLLWCEKDSFELSDNPRLGRTVLEIEGRKLVYVTNRFDEKIPDYAELAKLLRQQNTVSQKHVELHASPFVQSRHVKHVLNACAKAGITTVSIMEIENR